MALIDDNEEFEGITIPPIFCPLDEPQHSVLRTLCSYLSLHKTCAHRGDVIHPLPWGGSGYEITAIDTNGHYT